MTYFFFYQTKIGTLCIAEENGRLIHIGLNGALPQDINPQNSKREETALIRKAYAEIKEYLSGNLKKFDLPLEPRGTGFQLKIWSAMQKIPYGKTMSYGQLARAAGFAKAARAAGMACNRNPLPIVVPCHRVIGADGSLTGYGGGLEIKRFLLSLEK